MTPNNTPSRPTGPLPPRTAPRKVFDVMRPGRAPAPSTSKPVIVGHKPIVRDASVTLQGIGAPAPRPLMHTANPVSVQPAPPAPAPQTTAPVPASVAPAPPIAAPSAPSAPAPRTVPPLSPVPPPTSRVTSPVAIPPTPAPVHTSALVPAPMGIKQPGPVTVPAPGQGTDDGLLDEIRPLVPEDHDEVVSRRIGPGEFPWKYTILIGVILVLLAVLLNILVDAEFLSIRIPHTDFL